MYNMAQAATRAAAAPLVTAVCLLAAGCGEELDTAPREDYYHGPLLLSARIDGQSGTRAAYPAGPVKDGSTWYFSCPLAENKMSVLTATFDGSGYADLKTESGDPVELTWDKLHIAWGKGFLFVLDNVQVMSCDYNFYEIQGPDTVRIGQGVKFTEEMIDRYRAAVESEDGEINTNDVIQGYTSFTKEEEGKKVYIEIPLFHLMARLGIEVTSSVISLADEPVKVWIDHIAAESYGLNRRRSETLEKNTLFIRPFVMRGKAIYCPDSTDTEIYNHTFYLIGDENSSEKLIPKSANAGSADTFRTRRLILPPQSTHLDTDEDLRPRVYIEAGDKRYSSLLPGSVTVDGTPEAFGEFRSNEDITLVADISSDPPYISFSAKVRKWTYRGTHTLEAQQAGIYNEDDFEKAVKMFKAYAEARKTNPDDPETEKLRHGLEHYGHWDAGVFVFDFYVPLGEKESVLPEQFKVPDDEFTRGLFNVDLHAHTVYGCVGTSESEQEKGKGERDLKSKMLGMGPSGIETGEELKKALSEYCDYVKYMVSNYGDESPAVVEERMRRRALLEPYGWWDLSGKLGVLHISINADIPEDYPEDLNMTQSHANEYLQIEMNGHTVWGETDGGALKARIFGQ